MAKGKPFPNAERIAAEVVFNRAQAATLVYLHGVGTLNEARGLIGLSRLVDGDHFKGTSVQIQYEPSPMERQRLAEGPVITVQDGGKTEAATDE